MELNIKNINFSQYVKQEQPVLTLMLSGSQHFHIRNKILLTKYSLVEVGAWTAQASKSMSAICKTGSGMEALSFSSMSHVVICVQTHQHGIALLKIIHCEL